MQKTNPLAKAKQPAKGKQRDDFESVAKRLGCDDDKVRFEARLGKLAKAKNMPLKRSKRSV